MVIKRAGLVILAATSALFFARLAIAHKAITEEEELGIAPTDAKTTSEGSDSTDEINTPLD